MHPPPAVLGPATHIQIRTRTRTCTITQSYNLPAHTSYDGVFPVSNRWCNGTEVTYVDDAHLQASIKVRLSVLKHCASSTLGEGGGRGAYPVRVSCPSEPATAPPAHAPPKGLGAPDGALCVQAAQGGLHGQV